MPPDLNPLRRQIWATPTGTTTSLPKTCTPFRLPSGGFLNIGSSTILTITEAAVFQPACTGVPNIDSTPPEADSQVFNDQNPFYASTSPQIYAIAAATVISYMLVLILFITPRTLFAGGVGGGRGFLGHKGMISRASGTTSVIGAEGRPWLQKAAALTVAVSLTYASVDTFRVARAQYNDGYQDVLALTDSVVRGTAIKAIRLLSDIFLWLAQAQTLIKLFPRHKEKIIIEWTGLVLITLDTIFSALDCLLYESFKIRPRNFDNAVPALSYLFSSALSLIYAAMVMFYSFQKGRFAYFHPKMRNICLLAMLSLVAILIPLVFFILDIAKPNISGWGTYVRWVGAAAASVVVWEWVERIEALEAEERKDGILGREIYDGDEMLESTPSSEVSWPKAHRENQLGHGSGGSPGRGTSTGWKGTITVQSRLPRSRQLVHAGQNPGRDFGHHNALRQEVQAAGTHLCANYPTQPSAVASPISRGHTTSAVIPDLVVHHHTVSESNPPGRHLSDTSSDYSGECPQQPKLQPVTPTRNSRKTGNNSKVKSLFSGRSIWSSVFGQDRKTPPPEVSQGLSRMTESSAPTRTIPTEPTAASPYLSTLDRLRGKKAPNSGNATVPVIIIPAPPPSGRTSFIGTRATPEVGKRVDSTESDGLNSATREVHSLANAAVNWHENATQLTPMPSSSRTPYSPTDFYEPAFSQQGVVTTSTGHRTNAAQVLISTSVRQDGNASPQNPRPRQGPVISRYSNPPRSNASASSEQTVPGTGRVYSERQDEDRIS